MHEHVAARQILESLENWSGHGLSNRTGSASPELSVLQLVSCHVIEIQEIGFRKFGSELRRVVGLHQTLAGNVITCLEPLLNKFANAVSSSGVVITLERNILLRLRSKINVQKVQLKKH